jgi:ADP-ribose pyrophosphatase YjhB (NUDIX family)
MKYLIKIFSPIVISLLRLYWFIFRPKTFGVRCIIQFEDKILFIKHSYGSGLWSVPGGGIKRKESFEKAVRREVKEEVGIILKEVKKIGSYISTKEYKIDTVELFWSKVETDTFKIDNFEIIEARWATIDQIPKPCGENTKQILSYIKQHDN